MNIARLAINLVLIAVAAVVFYMLVQTVHRPINFQETMKQRSDAVKGNLTEIAQLQKMYKDLTGSYAGSFDTLQLVLTTATFRIERVLGDKYDSTQVVTRDTVSIPAIDSMRNFIKAKRGKEMDVNAYFAEVFAVPFAPAGTKFTVASGTAAVEGMDSLMQPSFEAGIQIGTFMADFPEKDYQIYNPDFSHSNELKVGDITKPNKLSGNW